MSSERRSWCDEKESGRSYALDTLAELEREVVISDTLATSLKC